MLIWMFVVVTGVAVLSDNPVSTSPSNPPTPPPGLPLNTGVSDDQSTKQLLVSTPGAVQVKIVTSAPSVTTEAPRLTTKASTTTKPSSQTTRKSDITTKPAVIPTTNAVPKKTATTAAPLVTTRSHLTTVPRVKVTPNPRANKTVCYEYVGCFDNFAPFDNAGLDLPMSPDVIGTKFWLFTRQNPQNSQYHVLDYRKPSTFNTSLLVKSKPVKFVIHGFTQDALAPWVMKMKDGFLKMGDFNVITVDWKKGAEFPNYDQAVANTRLVATQVKLVVEQLVEGGLQLKDVHMTGHSLGAHTSGYSGFLLKGKIGRISGMDPAEPNFENLADVVRLDSADAMFVDVIHTNGAPLLLGGAGLMERSGHVDFYVNGGEEQPGCKGGISGALSSLLSGGNIGKAVSCSHGRSHDLYVESMFAPCPFTAYPCSSFDEFLKGNCLTCGSTGCSQLGYYSNEYDARGKLYLKTAAKLPFCGYHYGIKIQTRSTKETKGRLYVKLVGKWGETDFLPVTGDENIPTGSDIQRVLVSPDEVGDLTSVGFKYVKHSGFWLGSGADTLSVGRIKLTSGENGYSYLFCNGGRQVQHNTEVTLNITNTSSCS